MEQHPGWPSEERDSQSPASRMHGVCRPRYTYTYTYTCVAARCGAAQRSDSLVIGHAKATTLLLVEQMSPLQLGCSAEDVLRKRSFRTSVTVVHNGAQDLRA